MISFVVAQNETFWKSFLLFLLSSFLLLMNEIKKPLFQICHFLDRKRFSVRLEGWIESKMCVWNDFEPISSNSNRYSKLCHNFVCWNFRTSLGRSFCFRSGQKMAPTCLLAYSNTTRASTNICLRTLLLRQSAPVDQSLSLFYVFTAANLRFFNSLNWSAYQVRFRSSQSINKSIDRPLLPLPVTT